MDFRQLGLHFRIAQYIDACQIAMIGIHERKLTMPGRLRPLKQTMLVYVTSGRPCSVDPLILDRSARKRTPDGKIDATRSRSRPGKLSTDFVIRAEKAKQFSRLLTFTLHHNRDTWTWTGISNLHAKHLVLRPALYAFYASYAWWFIFRRPDVEHVYSPILSILAQNSPLGWRPV